MTTRRTEDERVGVRLSTLQARIVSSDGDSRTLNTGTVKGTMAV
jgi:hypothetical protein